MTWPLVSLGEVAEFINGAAFKPEDWGGSGMPIVRIQNLTDPGKPYNRTLRVVSDRVRVRRGELLVSWSATLGVFEWGLEEDGLVNQHIFRVVPDEAIVVRSYLKHMLRDALLAMQKHAHGATMLHVNRGEFLATAIPLPPLPEQRRIASILDQADDLIQRRRQTLHLLDEATQAAFERASAMSKDSPPCRLGDVVSIDAPLVDPRLPAYAGLELITPDVIEKNTGRLAINPPKVGDVKPISGKYRFEPDNVLYSKIRPVLNKVLLPTSGGLCSADMYPLRVIDPALTREYIWAELRSSRFLDFAASFANRAQMPKLNRAQLLAYSFPKPTQQSRELLSSVETALTLARGVQSKQLEMADELFASLQHRAFSGQL